ncbi:MAG: DNA primase [Syntrophomonadaceae bacterium]|nr:DNA primase [Syntrophomonadaceae bacterium]
MSRFNEEVIREINSRLELADIVAETVQLTRKGNRYWGLCPFHQEKTSSFSVTPDRNMFYCFGCHAGGDMITYIMKRDNMDFREAVEYLANRAGVTVQKESPAARRKQERARGVVAANLAAAQLYREILLSAKGKKGLEYLQERRLSPEIVEKFGLGFAPDNWNTIEDYLFKKAFSQEQVKSTGLIKRSDQQNRYYDLFRNRVIFPIHDQRGEVIGFGGRVLDGSLPKYLNTPETELFSKRKNLYGLYQARQAMRNLNQALVVEGYMDCLKMHQAGIENTVATLGTAMTQEQARLLRRFVEEVVLLFDGDDAGQREALRAVEVLRAEGLKVWVVSLPGGKDPDDYLDLYGKEEFLQYIQNSKVDHIEFKLNRYIETETELNLDTRIRIIKAVQKDIASLESELEKDYYVRLLSRRLQVQENLIRRELNKGSSGRSSELNKSGILRDNTRYGKSSLEERLLVSMLKNTVIFEQVQETVGLNIFRNTQYRQMIHSYADLLPINDHSWDDLGNIARLEGFASAYARVSFLMEEEPGLKPVEVQGIIRRIQMRRRELRWQKLQERLNQISEDADFDQLLRFILDLDTFINPTHKGVTT